MSHYDRLKSKKHVPYNFTLGLTEKLDKRKEKLTEFIIAVIHPSEYPWFVSDEASVYDISGDDTAELLEKCKTHYGIELHSNDLLMPLWQLLDYLEIKRQKRLPIPDPQRNDSPK